MPGQHLSSKAHIVSKEHITASLCSETLDHTSALPLGAILNSEITNQEKHKTKAERVELK